MKISRKSKEEILIMAEGGKRLAFILEQLLQLVRPGVTALEIEKRANELIDEAGGSPSFKMVPGYRWATCINFNEGVVHGIPTGRKILPGDLVSIDIGLFYQGFHSDVAWTVVAGESWDKNQKEIKLKRQFLLAGERTIKKVLETIEPDWEIKDISCVIQEGISKAGFFPVRSLTGHGIGRKLHELPAVPCFYLEGMPSQKLKPGMVLAIEVIYSRGGSKLKIKDDDWTVETNDGSWAALFEADIAIGEDKIELLTPLAKLEG